MQWLVGIADSLLPLIGGFFENDQERAAWEAELARRQMELEQAEIQQRQAALQLAAAQSAQYQKSRQITIMVVGGVAVVGVLAWAMVSGRRKRR